MYIPKYYEITDKEEINSFIDRVGFGQLVSNVGGRIISTHLPLLLSEDKSKIIGHLALPNPQHDELEGQEVLVTFEGAHDYISPSWYVSPGVPTWNYQTVHIYGFIKFIKDLNQVREVVDTLTKKYESKFEKPWEPRYKDNMLKGIVAFELKISECQCKYKLSQNRSVEDRAQVIEQLKKYGSNSLAEAMEKNEL